MGWLPMLIEIVQRVPFWGYTAIGGLGFGLWLGYKIGVFRSWISERALARALKIKVPKLLEAEDE